MRPFLACTATVAAVATAQTMAGPAQAARTATSTYTAALSASEEVPSPGPAGATGTASVTIDTVKNQLCYAVTWSKEVGTPSAGHIHLGAKGTSGPIEVVLNIPAQPKSCLQVDNSVLQGIVSSPSSHYVNVHSQAYPGGAVRGQLH